MSVTQIQCIYFKVNLKFYLKKYGQVILNDWANILLMHLYAERNGNGFAGQFHYGRDDITVTVEHTTSIFLLQPIRHEL